MVKILIIGNGAREHAIAKAIMRSLSSPKLYAYMKAHNPGIAELCEQVKIGNYSDIEAIRSFAKSVTPEFAVIGPEEPLANGIVDILEKSGIPCIGPKKELAKLETSKSFTRLLMQKYKIDGNPKFRIFKNLDGINEFMNELGKSVIKPDGLTAGKGVKVQGEHFQTIDEGHSYCKEILKTHPSVIIEEKIDGEEFSLQSFTDGIAVIDCPPVQDHKRAFEGDKGPNTGGMGSYSDADHLLPFLKKEHINAAHKITQKVADALREETGEMYKGVMYGGFILTKDGVKLIEYNARMGDPEAMNVLSIMKSDFVELCKAIIKCKLNHFSSEFEKKATVCKYVVPEGYPDNPVKGEKIFLNDTPENVEIFYASVDKKNDELYMSGSRAIAFVGTGKDISDAEKMAEKAIFSVKGRVFHRRDIGTQELIGKRVAHIKKIMSSA